MRVPIAFPQVEEDSNPIARSEGSSAPQLEGSTVALRFRFQLTDSDSLEALRYARRAMLREEWTRGLEEGEPSLDDAVFSAFEVVWPVGAEARERCLEKVSELVQRANRALADLSRRIS